MDNRLLEIETTSKRLVTASLVRDADPEVALLVPGPDLTPEQDRLFREVQNLKTDRVGAVKSLAAWIAASVAGPSSDEPFDERTTLTTLQGACGAKDIVLTRVAQAMEIPVRRIGFYGNPIFGAHTATEVFVDGRWRFIDSTFGVYFTRTDSDEMLSIAEARALFPEVSIWRADVPLWTGRWQRMQKFVYSKEVRALLVGQDGPLADVERTYFASKMVGAAEQPVIFSNIVWDLRRTSFIRIGARDGSAADMDNLMGGNVLPLLERVGRFTNIQTGSRFRIITDVPAEVSVRVAMLNKQGHILVDLDHRANLFSLEQTKLDRSEDDNSITVKFKVFPPYSTLSLWSQGAAFGIVDSYGTQVLSKD